jgi:hypothetical protein
MHKWLAITLFPRDDVRPMRNDELMILYAMVNKIKISPVKAMVKQWLRHFKMMGPIECTSLITRIASSIGVLDGNSIPFIKDPHILIDETYLIYGDTLKKGPKYSFIFLSLGYANEILLPNAGYHLYNCQSLTTPHVPQEVACRHSVSGLPGRMTKVGPEGRQHQLHHLHSLSHHIHIMQMDLCGTAQAPTNGHRKPQGASPPAPALAGSHT